MAQISLFRNIFAIQYTGTGSVTELQAAASAHILVTVGNPFTITITNATSSGFRINYLESGVIYGYEDWSVNDYMVFDKNASFPQGYSPANFATRYLLYGQAMTALAGTPEFAAAVTAGTARSFNNAPGRSLVTGTGATGFQVSASRDAHVSYSVAMSTTATIGGAATATVVLEICPTNSATPANWIEIARISNSQTITLAVALQSVQGVSAQLSGVVPAGYYAKLRSTVTGTASATYSSGQEVLL